jgi:hypothetical protein
LKRISSFVNGVIVKGKYGAWGFPNATKRLFEVCEQQLIERDQQFLETSKYLHHYLRKFTFDRKWIVTEKQPVLYRRVPGVGPASDPLSVTGSFGCGGRFNMGASQVNKTAKQVFSNLAFPRGAHYSSNRSVTARKEYGDYGMPASTAITYRLTLKRRKRFKLIDVDAAVSDLEVYFAALPKIVRAGSLGGTYADIKNVIPTQLFGHWLMNACPISGVDGLRFESQVDQGGTNYCLYIPNDAACKSLLKCRKIRLNRT